MFIGQYFGNLGEKRRIAVPKKFRIALGEKMIVARWYEKCLVLLPEGSWSALLTKVFGDTKNITQSIRDTERFLLSSAYELDPDDQGRVILPDILCEYASLTDEVVFLGLSDRVEIWNKTDWQTREAYVSEKASELLDNLAQSKTNE